MRFIYLAATVGLAVVVQFIAPVALVGASPAHADTGINNFVHCIQSNPGVPPRASADDWAPTVQMIENDINGAVPSAEIVKRLVTGGATPRDAAVEVQCVYATYP